MHLELVDELGFDLRDCVMCDLSSLPGNNVVPGFGNHNATVMVIQGAPSEDDNNEGQPNSGKAGKQVRNLLKLAGVQPEEVYFTSAAKCLPDVDKNGKRKRPAKVGTLKKCAVHWLNMEIDEVDPDFIITMGADALSVLFPGESVTNVHGQVLELDKYLVIPMNDVNASYYNPKAMEIIKEDFTRIPQKLKRAVEGEEKVPAELLTIDSALDMARSCSKGEPIAIDFETTGLRTWLEDIAGIALATGQKSGYLPTVGWSEDQISSFLKLLFIDGHEATWIAHNAKYELGMLRRYGVVIMRMEDTMEQAALLCRPVKGLKALVLQEFGYKMIEISELIGSGKNQISFADVPIDEAIPYASADAWFTLKLWHVFNDLMPEGGEEVYNEIELPLLPAITDMENFGCPLDPVAVQQGLDKLEPEIDEALGQFINDLAELGYEAPDDFNINSWQQTLKALKAVKVPTKSTDSKVLLRLAADYPIVLNVIEIRHLKKLRNTYLVGLDLMKERAYGSVNPVGTGTGRFSYSGWKIPNPEPTGKAEIQWGVNLQTIPKPKMWEDANDAESNLIRQCFIAEPGYTLMEADYSQIELRVMAHMADDDAMIEAYLDDRDIHNETIELAGLEDEMPEADADSIRRVAKIVNFGTQYEPDDRSASYVVRRTCAEAKVFMTEEQAEAIVAAKRDAYPGVTRYYNKIKADMKRQGYVETEFGRRMYAQWLDGWGRQVARTNNAAWREAVNMPIQGTAADIIKKAIVEIWNHLHEIPGMKIVWTVHDSILFMVPDALLKEAEAWVTDKMENIYTLVVPLLVDVKAGKNLAELEKIA